MAQSDYVRSLLKLALAGETLFDEGDFTINYPEEWQAPSAIKTSGGRTRGRNLYPDANEITIDVMVSQNTPTSGRLMKLIQETQTSPVELSIGHVTTDHLRDGAETGAESPNVTVHGGTSTHGDEAAMVDFTLHCVGFSVGRKNADSIQSTDFGA